MCKLWMLQRRRLACVRQFHVAMVVYAVVHSPLASVQ